MKVFLSIILLSTLAFAAKKPVPVVDKDYILALSAADHLMQAWQTGDLEAGVVMLTDAAKQGTSEDQLDEFFAADKLGTRGFELTHGKKLEAGKYDFPVALFEGKGKPPRLSHLIVIKESKNEWVVDSLPQ
ncbi:MAG TPA: hypothetical protein VH088_01290 [Terriglobales bacterium]|nr:hypothetical protein [Terriglobales bacterium]